MSEAQSRKLHAVARVRRALMLVLLAGALPGCDRNVPRDPLLLAAASDLAAAMPELTAAFQESAGVAAAATLGSSGQLAQQILQGAPVDVFLSADRGWVERLDSAGRLVQGTAAVYAYGRLVVLSRAHGPAREIGELSNAAIGRIAIANAEHAPYGRAAQQALASAGVLDNVRARLVIAETVRQTVQMVETGAVDAALSALSLMKPAEHQWTLVPAHLHDTLEQTIAVIGGRPRQAEAEAFVRFILGPRGREILARHGFVLPETP